MTLSSTIHGLLGQPTSIGIEAFDGSAIHPPGESATLRVQRPEALARLITAPGELGVVRAFVSGDVEVEGDLFQLLALGFDDRPPLDRRSVARVAKDIGLRLVPALLPPPRPPAVEARLRGRRHSIGRDAEAITHHYDVSNEFYQLLLGPSMTYSCAVFTDPHESLERAQAHKHELVCKKLGLQPGDRLLDVGCGWGELLIHAADHHGVTGVGITISASQAELAAKRVARAGLEDRIEIRLQDYRLVTDGPFDAISSIGMFEHVGRAQQEAYARGLFALLGGEGRLLNHAIGRPVVAGLEEPLSPQKALWRRLQVAIGSTRPSRIDSELMKRYVFPDGELHEVGSVVTLLQEAGFEVRHLESLREHYALTLRHWVANLEENWNEAVTLVGEARARVWRLYLAGCAIGFEKYSTDVHQTLAVKPGGGTSSGFPLRPHFEL